MWIHLGAKGAHTRLLALHLCAELWERSSAFRHLLLSRIEQFIQLVFGGPTAPLPPPSSSRDRLRTLASELLHKWHASHGSLEGYTPLALALRHLRLNRPSPILSTTTSLPHAPSPSSAVPPPPFPPFNPLPSHPLLPRFPSSVPPALPPFSTSTPLSPPLRHLRVNLPASQHHASRRQAALEANKARLREKYAELSANVPTRIAEMRRAVAEMRECLRMLAPTMEDGEGDGGREGGLERGGMGEGARKQSSEGINESRSQLLAEGEAREGEGEDGWEAGGGGKGREGTMGADGADEVDESEEWEEGEGGEEEIGWADSQAIEIDLRQPEQGVSRNTAPTLDALTDLQVRIPTVSDAPIPPK